MLTAEHSTDRCLVLHDVDWRTYERLVRAFGERPAVRLTYDRGMLEIRSPLSEHESDAYLLGRFVDALTDELAIPIKAGRCTTFRHRRRRRGLEPDNSYWIASEPQVRGKRHINLHEDPPPDLAIEVDVTRSSLDRMKIYAALRVAEVWRLDGSNELSFHVLQPEGMYKAVSHSLSFPLVTPGDLVRFLALQDQLDDMNLVRQFRAWVRPRASGTAESS